jgi:hypothetical protein
VLTNAELYINNNLVGSAALSGNNIYFPSINIDVSGSQVWKIRGYFVATLPNDPSPFNVSLESMNFTASANVVGGPINFGYALDIGGGPQGPNPRGPAYSLISTDAQVNRVVVEYGAYSGNKFSFYSELHLDPALTIVGASLQSPSGRLLNYDEDVNTNEWSLDGLNSVGAPYSTLFEMNADFGPGTYILSIDSGAGIKTVNFNLNPTLVKNLPIITNPVVNANIPLTGFGVDWSYTGSANFFEAIVENIDRTNVTVADNVFSAFLAKHDGTEFAQNTQYQLGVAAVTVAKKFVVTADDGDNIDVLFQQWQETQQLVSTGGGVGAVLVQENANFSNPGSLLDGQTGIKVFSAFMSTDMGTVDVSSIRFAGMNDSLNIADQIANPQLAIYVSGSLAQTLTGTLSSNGILFTGPITVNANVPYKMDLHVDILSFPAYGFLDLELKGMGVATNLGPGYSNGPIVSHLMVGDGGFGTVFVRNPRFEVGPEVHPLNASTNISTFFTFQAGPSDSGFDYLKVNVPSTLGSVGAFDLMVSSGPNATFTTLVPSSQYNINYDSVMSSINIHFTTTQTAFTSNGGYYKLDFSAMTGLDESLSNPFDVVFINSSLAEEMYATPDAAVNPNLINDPQDPSSIQIRFQGTVSETPNVSFVEAEVDTYPTSLLDSPMPGIAASENVMLKFFVKVDVGSTDLGFDVIRINLPVEMTADQASVQIAKATIDGSGIVSYNPLTATHMVTAGQVRSQLSGIQGPGVHFLAVEMNVFTGAVFEMVNFGVAVNNSGNPSHPFVAIMGQSEMGIDDFGLDALGNSEMGKWNGLSVPVLQDLNLPVGTALADLKAEIETVLGYAEAGQDVSITMNIAGIQNDTVTTGVGYNVMTIDFPYGYSLKGAIVLSTNGSAAVASSFATVNLISADPLLGQTAGAKINFAQVQGTGNLYLTFNLTAPEQEVQEDFNIEVLNTGYLYSNVVAHPGDVDADGVGTLLSLRSVAVAGSFTNVSDLTYEVDVIDGSTPRDGLDMGAVATGETPGWRVFVKPSIQGADVGFNIIHLLLPDFLLSGFPTDIKVFKTTSANVTSPTTWTLLTCLATIKNDISDN